jgi:AraC-like DNA-binding protein
MEKAQTLEGFYRTFSDIISPDQKIDLGHFNVFKLDELGDAFKKCSFHARKQFFKICLMSGSSYYHYGSKTVLIEKNALIFTNPTMFYHWDLVDDQQSGRFCIFTEEFFNRSAAMDIWEYPVFKCAEQSVFLLSDERFKKFELIFDKMLAEAGSSFYYKYDVLRNLALEIILEALKMLSIQAEADHSNAATRLTCSFMKALEKQFPIDSPSQQINLRTPIEFACQLNVSVNHLNKALREITGNTTTTIITARVLQEAKILLRYTKWNISEIAWCLGFEELPHFIHFFKKNAHTTPTVYRSVID